MQAEHAVHEASPARRGKPRILVLNQYYWPGVEATGQLLSQLCADLSEEFDITVVTGTVSGAAPGRTQHAGVEIVRVRSATFDRRRLSLRAVNYLTFLGQSLVEGLRADPPDIVLCMTDPPVIADVALLVARRFDAPLVVISQDIFPEIAVELKRLDSPLVIAPLRLATRLYLERADRVVAIGETMRRRLEHKGADPDRVVVIPNWVDTTDIEPRPRDNAWSREHDLLDRFVVMHSGNIGHAQDLDTLIRAGTFLRDLTDLRIAVIGGGARRDELKALTKLHEVESVYFWGYQPREMLADSLSSAHVHVVGLARGLSGYVVPSRLYGILAAGRPVLVAADDDSETARVVREVDCGVVVPPGRPELLAAQIRRAHDGELDLEAMGRRAREYVTAEADRHVAIGRYRELLWGLVDRRNGTP
jgi:glycosyltransferase involved in cell wall biosynthesis